MRQVQEVRIQSMWKTSPIRWKWGKLSTHIELDKQKRAQSAEHGALGVRERGSARHMPQFTVKRGRHPQDAKLQRYFRPAECESRIALAAATFSSDHEKRRQAH